MMNRRQFIKGTGLTAFGAAALSSEFAWGDPLGLPIGLQLYTVGDDMAKDAPGTIKKVAEIGYKEVETAGFGSVNTAAALRKVLDDNGLKCPSAHLSFDLKNLNKAFDDAHALGCTYATASVPRLLIIEMPSLTDAPPADRPALMQKMIAAISAPMSSDELKKVIDAMNQVGDAASQQGLKLASHNHTFEFQIMDGKPVIHHLIAKTDPNNVKFEIDCGWAELAGYNPVELVNSFPGRIKMLHVKDFLAFEKGARNAKGTELGKGVLDYKGIFAGVKRKGIEHIFVEQEPPFTEMPAIQAAEVDYKYLHSLS